MKHLVDKYSKRPNISFRTIYVVDKPLRSHIGRRTNANILELTLTMGRKSKVSDLRLTMSHQYIGCFDIPMHYIHRFQVEQSLEYIFEYGICLIYIFLIAEMPLPEQFGQVSTLAILVNSIAVVIGPEIFEACYYIRMFQSFYDVQLLPKQLLNTHLFYLLQLHDLYSNLESLQELSTIIYLGKCPLSDLTIHIDPIVLDSLIESKTIAWRLFCLLLSALTVEILNSL